MAMTTDKIRNLGLVGQRGSGKTMLAEAMAFASGITNRLGRVEDGSTLSDYTDEERSHQTSLNLSILPCPWKSHKVNVLDLPGHMDFIGDVLSGLIVADAVGIVVDAGSGVEVGTHQYFGHVTKAEKSAFFIVNRLDKENTDFAGNVAAIQGAFGNKAVPIHLPLGAANDFKGVVDLLKMKAITFDDKGKGTIGEIPGDMQDAANSAREKLMEAVAESDDALLEKFFDKGELTDEEIRTGLKKGVTEASIYPIMAVSATSNIGASSVLDFAVEFAPSPADVTPVKAKEPGGEKETDISCTSDGPVAAYVFKTISEQHIGDLSLVRIYSGKLSSGLDVVNVGRGSERIGQIYEVRGKDRKEVDAANAGDIVALVKLKDTHTGDSLCAKDRQVELPKPLYPDPVMDMAIRPRAKGDEEKMGMGLNKFNESDPTFKVVQDPALKQTLLFGQGDAQIDLLVEKLKSRFGVEVELEKPKVPYRETVKSKVEAQGKYKKQSGGRGQYGDCWLRIEPLPRGEGFEFVNEIKGGVIPNKFIPSVEKGVVEAMQEGSLCGAPVVDVKVAVYFGSYHTVDSSDMAFKVAGSMGFKEGYLRANPLILEPIYNIEVIVPDDYTGDVMGDISSRRGKIIGMDPVGAMKLIKASVPQAELYKYSVDLRSLTQGQGFYKRDFSRYEEVPPDVSMKLQEEYKAERRQET